MKDSIVKEISARYSEDMALKMTSLKTLSVLDGIVDDDRLDKGKRLYLLSEIENWAKSKQITALHTKVK